MPTFVASYDLEKTNPDPHGEFLKQAQQYGWKTWILSNGNIWHHLPNTTLEGTFDNITIARNAFNAAMVATAKVKPIVVEKWIIVEYGNNLFDSDVRRPR
ncbi:hypothetical protein [Bradyrhizobium sp. AC87j1]|uniref:hypothetical protein n=1 Tax=Bradyrhizobium sp. AC87j1 TaxID=2055894 RepID=UPI0011B0C4AD|nr:hypothetical protein [Bradyrhizobium sp. AC87j1]